MKNPYSKRDGLILVSTGGADKGRGASVPDIIAYARMIKDDLLTPSDVEDVMGVFLKEGLVTANAERFALAAKVRVELNDALGREGKWAEMPDKALSVLMKCQGRSETNQKK